MPGSQTVRHQGLLKLQLAFFFYPACYGLASASIFLLGEPEILRSPGLKLSLLLFVLALVIVILTNYVFDRFRYALTIGALFACGAFLAVVIRYGKSRLFVALSVVLRSRPNYRYPA